LALYVAGQRIRASELNRLPQMYYVTSAVTKNNSSTFSDVTGLGFSADASSRYFVECFIFFSTAAARDIKFQWTFPSGATGYWGASGTESGDADCVGDGNRQSLNMQTPGVHAFAGDNGVDSWCDPHLTCLTSTTPGTIQLQFAQLSASGSDTIVRAGSAIRVTKLTS
jgi:hypothetical protein